MSIIRQECLTETDVFSGLRNIECLSKAKVISKNHWDAAAIFGGRLENDLRRRLLYKTSLVTTPKSRKARATSPM